MQYAQALIVLGQRDRALTVVRPILDRIKVRSQADPENDTLLTSLAYAQALAGDHDGALATVNHFLSLLKPGAPVRKVYFNQANAAIILAWIGEKDRTVDLLQPMMAVPVAATNSIEALRRDIDFSPLHGFPRWEAMLADPANRQPFKY